MSKPRYDWWGYVKGMIRRYPTGTNENETRAVLAAIEQTRARKNGEERLKVIRLVFWTRSGSLTAAAMEIPCCERTAQRWHADFIRDVAKNFRCNGLA